MFSTTPVIQTLDDLRDYVTTILCQHEKLEPDAFPLTERVLMRAERPCGMYFCLHGPRAVKYSAIWDTEHNTVLFYGATGERFHKASLAENLRLEQRAA